MADLDITERRHPQDGHISFTSEKKTFDLRVSTMPTVAGEKVVIRILEKDAEKFHLDKLGLSPDQCETVHGFLGTPYGMILVTGPTGSGKSTTLYAMLSHLNQPTLNIVTLEDPVENQMPGMNQIGVNPSFGMTFATGLKYILRQDPDIVMVGEIRDGETAEIAIQSALTGHLLLSTLHTNDAAGAVTRLVQLGVQPFLVASSLIGVVAQRLLRRACSNCQVPWTPPEEMLAEFGHLADRLAAAELVRGEGCDRCFGTGYRGRCGVFELLRVTPEMGVLVERRGSANEIKALAVRQGMGTLMEAGVAKALAGETTLDEVRQRVLVWEEVEQLEPAAAGG
jgi:type II secretory ATPase GspE/PulE/Tfp pilus assembly ATPase PilB-like protein